MAAARRVDAEALGWSPTAEDMAYAMPTGLAYYDTRDHPRPYEPSRFHAYLNQVCLDLAFKRPRADFNGEAPDRVLLTVPPRHGKSTISSHYFPAWFLGRWPHKRVMLTTYADNFAWYWSRKVRDTLATSGETIFGPKATVRSDVSAVKEWETLGGGGLLATGAGGGMTGRGTDLLVVDDPIKNAEEANSVVIRDGVWEMLLSTAFTRVEPGGIIIVTLTRWHQDDPGGRILKRLVKEEGEPWLIVNFPAIAEEHDTLGRQPGEALWPEKWPVPLLMRRKRTVGSYWWHALYQQQPSPPHGSIFRRDWFRYFDIQEVGGREWFVLQDPVVDGGKVSGFKPRRIDLNRCWLFQTIDTADTEDEQADFFVIGTWAWSTATKELLLLELRRFKAETTRHKAEALKAWHHWRPYGLRLVGVEKKNSGKNLWADLRADGIATRPLKAEGDKLSRSQVMSTLYENGQVYHYKGPGSRGWLGDYEDELVNFPTGEHDDQVDVASYAGLVVTVNRPREARVF